MPPREGLLSALTAARRRVPSAGLISSKHPYQGPWLTWPSALITRLESSQISPDSVCSAGVEDLQIDWYHLSCLGCHADLRPCVWINQTLCVVRAVSILNIYVLPWSCSKYHRWSYSVHIISTRWWNKFNRGFSYRGVSIMPYSISLFVCFFCFAKRQFVQLLHRADFTITWND